MSALLFTPIELASWPRGQMFYYYSKMAPTGYSVTVNVDVTQLRATVKRAGVKFFPAYLWIVTKNLNRQVEFKVAEKDGVVGYYDTLTPLYASFHEDDKTFSLMWTPYSESFPEFYEAYLDNKRRFGENHGVLAQPEALPPANAYVVSCVPWVRFESFCLHSYGNNPYYFPSVEAGKLFDEGGRTLMPLSLTCHHATTDGWHIDRFLKDLDADMERFGEYVRL